ncbi:hypothetical protein Patl1_09561 [Pistacia atlantica]|uniref:Uncharacterized protein n=1 Tax=Pistacia atlantica TaxID=434234 RepID=A0ACC1AE59_9ROSI|nr:hypothetical protein Patl1_09561 [Pistacia atlantica]
MGSEQNRFPQQERRKRWGGCLGALSCFGTQKGGKRIVPASRMPEGNASVAQPNGPQAAGLTNQATTLAPSLLAPPSSPASFTNSALPSTAQSPSCFLSLSANSPGGPSSTMFATGPYAHETQLVSPPVFSTFTTEPSTAPFTPPPELAHPTTPSSPDVPFARFLTSSMDLKGLLVNVYHHPFLNETSLLTGILQFLPRTTNIQGVVLVDSMGMTPLVAPESLKDTNFFCPATFAQFYLDHNPPFPHTGGRLSVSKDSDVYSSGANGHQNRHTKSPKQDVEELEAYRASFGFSADEIITTPQYVEISDIMEDSFTMTPFTSDKPAFEVSVKSGLVEDGQKSQRTETKFMSQKSLRSDSDIIDAGEHNELTISCNGYEGNNGISLHNLENKPKRQPTDVSGSSTPGNHILTDEEDIFSKMGSSSRISRKYHLGMSSSDAEIDYRRGRSLREGRGDFAWHD